MVAVAPSATCNALGNETSPMMLPALATYTVLSCSMVPAVSGSDCFCVCADCPYADTDRASVSVRNNVLANKLILFLRVLVEY